MSQKSEYIIIIENIKGDVETDDIKEACSNIGKMRGTARNRTKGMFLAEYVLKADAKKAWTDLERTELGKNWVVHRGKKQDVLAFGWPWNERDVVED